MNIGALDGRYRNKVAQLAPLTSEYGLLRYRVLVECRWFAHLAQCDGVSELPQLDATAAAQVPGWDGFAAAHTNFRMIANHIATTEEALNSIHVAYK